MPDACDKSDHLVTDSVCQSASQNLSTSD